MVDLFEVPDEELKQTKLLLKHEFKSRGWSARLAYGQSPIIHVNRNDGRPELTVYSSTPPSSSYPLAKLVDDKFATYKFLESYHVAQLETLQYIDPSIRTLRLSS
jgi:hypothetical protein